MTGSATVPGIIRAQDARIRACLEGRSQAHFWYACCPMSGPAEASLQQFHALGFDNYPLAQIPAVDALRTYLFFFERILGAKVVSPAGHDGDFFQTWCQPWIRNTAQVSGLRLDVCFDGCCTGKLRHISKISRCLVNRIFGFNDSP